jgi:hypothetical protein
MLSKFSTNSEEELIEHLGEECKAIQDRQDALDLWNAIVATQKQSRPETMIWIA